MPGSPDDDRRHQVVGHLLALGPPGEHGIESDPFVITGHSAEATSCV